LCYHSFFQREAQSVNDVDDLDILFLFPPINHVSITKQDITGFKDSYRLKQDVPLKIQEMRASNSFTVNGKDYTLDDLERIEEIFAPDFKFRIDGEEREIPQIKIFFKEVGTSRMIVSFDEEFGLETILIGNLNTGVTEAELIPFAGRYLVTITQNDVNEESYSSYILAEAVSPNNRHKPSFDINDSVLGTEISSPDVQDDLEEVVEAVTENFEGLRDNIGVVAENIIEEVDDIFFKFISRFPGLYSRFACREYQMIEIAVDFESSFCNGHGGGDKSFENVAKVIAATSMKYQQRGLCRKVQMTQMDGYCNNSTDPYVESIEENSSGCFTDWGMLDDFKEFFNANNTRTKRDASVLISGSPLECTDVGCVVGCAFVSTLCEEDRGYAVVDAGFTQSVDYRAILVAHELGHVAGASHKNVIPPKTGTYIMEPAIRTSAEGFSKSTIRSMNRYMRGSGCPNRVQPAHSSRREIRAKLLKRLHL